jgi:hypothetical protein
MQMTRQAADRPIWVWLINNPDRPGDIFGALRRCNRAHWTAEAARTELHARADEMRIGRIKWDEVDDRTWVGRSDLGYIRGCDERVAAARRDSRLTWHRAWAAHDRARR